MNIEYLGHSCFAVRGSFSVVTDPFGDIGYEMKKTEADFCLLSHGHFDHCAAENVSGAKVVRSESDVALAKDISLECVPTFHDRSGGKLRGKNNVYKFIVDGVCFCHFGDLGEDFSNETAKRIGECDVLFIPVGGNYTIDAATAEKFAAATSAKLIVPMHFKTPRSNIDIEGLDDFKSRYKSIISANGVFNVDREALEKTSGQTLLVFNTDNF